MTLKEWIAAYGGRGKVSLALGVTKVALVHWLNGSSTPRIETMRKIEELSKGKVTVLSIIEETKPAPKKTRRA